MDAKLDIPDPHDVLDFELALRYVQRARAIGVEHGLKVTVAVHDGAGHPVLVARGSHKWHGPYMAMGKARLAAAFGKPTAVLLDNWRDRPLFAASLNDVLPGGVTLNPGGYPIVAGSRVIGAIGVGGGTPDQDHMVARLTVESLAGVINGAAVPTASDSERS
jgi:glc operon protein GlcG